MTKAMAWMTGNMKMSMDDSDQTAADIITRGFVYVKESEELLQELRALAMSTVDGMAARRRKDDNEVCRAVRSAVSSYLYKHTKRNPMILPVIMEI